LQYLLAQQYNCNTVYDHADGQEGTEQASTVKEKDEKKKAYATLQCTPQFATLIQDLRCADPKQKASAFGRKPRCFGNRWFVSIDGRSDRVGRRLGLMLEMCFASDRAYIRYANSVTENVTRF